MTLDDIRAFLAQDLQAVDTALAQQLKSPVSLIAKIAEHVVDSGGKRLRPMVVLLAAHLFNYRGDHHIMLAAMLELIHTATLLHDDVVDNSHLRRGRQTANAIWDNSASVLVGDFLYSRSFEMMVAAENLEILRLLSRTTNIIAEGEVLQLLNRHNADTTVDAYLEVIHRKTGALFSAAAQLGPLLAQIPRATCEALGMYGLELGIAFQLIDDILDYRIQSTDIGKPHGSDLAEGKPTLPIIYALQKADNKEKKFLQNVIREGDISTFDQTIDIIERTGGITYTYEQATQHAKRAAECLATVPNDSVPYEALQMLTNFVVQRLY